mmetsp:Transcript_20452/g.38136  ORF Transcript_20452/g.38136 Transcript_20452/m.38136 type:complete len:204 (+) Transcript_20452:937-1548(+)
MSSSSVSSSSSFSSSSPPPPSASLFMALSARLIRFLFSFRTSTCSVIFVILRCSLNVHKERFLTTLASRTSPYSPTLLIRWRKPLPSAICSATPGSKLTFTARLASSFATVLWGKFMMSCIRMGVKSVGGRSALVEASELRWYKILIVFALNGAFFSKCTSFFSIPASIIRCLQSLLKLRLNRRRRAAVVSLSWEQGMYLAMW